MLFKIINYFFFFLDGLFDFNSLLFKGFFTVPVYLLYGVVNFFNFCLFKPFFFLVVIQFNAFLGFVVVVFSVWYFIRLSVFNSVVVPYELPFSDFFINFNATLDFSKFFGSVFLSEEVNRLEFFAGLMHFSKNLHENFVRRPRYLLIRYRKLDFLPDQLHKSQESNANNFFARYHIRKRVDYTRTEDELYIEAYNKSKGRLKPPYTDFEYSRIFMENYEEYTQKLEPLIVYNRVRPSWVNCSYLNNDYFHVVGVSSFYEKIFIPFCNYIYTAVLYFDAYFLAELFSVISSFNVLATATSLFNTRFDFFSLTLLFYTSLFFYCVCFFGLIYYKFELNAFFVSPFSQIRRIFTNTLLSLKIVFIGFTHVNWAYQLNPSLFFRFFKTFEFKRFKKFRNINIDYANYKTTNWLKSAPYDSNKIYAQSSFFSTNAFNSLKSTYPGFESWDCTDFMLNPVEFNLYYANQPFNFQINPSVSVYRSRPGVSKFKNRFNYFFINEFSFPFTYFEENFTKLSSYVSKFVYSIFYIFFFIPVFCFELFRFLVIQVFIIYFNKASVYFWFFRNKFFTLFEFANILCLVISLFIFRFFIFWYICFGLVLIQLSKVFISFRLYFFDKSFHVFYFFINSCKFLCSKIISGFYSFFSYLMCVYQIFRIFYFGFPLFESKARIATFLVVLALVWVKLQTQLSLIQFYIEIYCIVITFVKIFYTDLYDSFFFGSAVLYFDFPAQQWVTFFMANSISSFFFFMYKICTYSFSNLLYLPSKLPWKFDTVFLRYLFGTRINPLNVPYWFRFPTFFADRLYRFKFTSLDLSRATHEHDPSVDDDIVPPDVAEISVELRENELPPYWDYEISLSPDTDFMFDFDLDAYENIFAFAISPAPFERMYTYPFWGHYFFPPIDFPPFSTLNELLPYGIMPSEANAYYAIELLRSETLEDAYLAELAFIDAKSKSYLDLFQLFCSYNTIERFEKFVSKPTTSAAFNFYSIEPVFYYILHKSDANFYMAFGAVEQFPYSTPFKPSFSIFDAFRKSEYFSKFFAFGIRQNLVFSNTYSSYSFLSVERVFLFDFPHQFFKPLSEKSQKTPGLFITKMDSFRSYQYPWIEFDKEFRNVSEMNRFFEYASNTRKSRFSSVFEIFLFNKNRYSSKYNYTQYFVTSQEQQYYYILAYSTANSVAMFYTLIYEADPELNPFLVSETAFFNEDFPPLITLPGHYPIFEAEVEEYEDEVMDFEFEEEYEVSAAIESSSFKSRNSVVDKPRIGIWSAERLDFISAGIWRPQDIPPVRYWPWKHWMWDLWEYIKILVD